MGSALRPCPSRTPFFLRPPFRVRQTPVLQHWRRWGSSPGEGGLAKGGRWRPPTGRPFPVRPRLGRLKALGPAGVGGAPGSQREGLLWTASSRGPSGPRALPPVPPLPISSGFIFGLKVLS